MCAPLTHYGILKTQLLKTKPWASYGFWHQKAGRAPVEDVFESIDYPSGPEKTVWTQLDRSVCFDKRLSK